MMTPVITQLYIVADFKINQEIIAELFCIKRSEVKSGCHGNCFLTNRLKEQDQQEKSKGLVNINFKYEILFLHISKLQPTIDAGTEIVKCFGFKDTSFYLSNYLVKIFIPPRFSNL